MIAASTAPCRILGWFIAFVTALALALFANLRNVGDAPDDVKVYGPSTPAAARFRQRIHFGSLWMFGVKGTF